MSKIKKLNDVYMREVIDSNIFMKQLDELNAYIIFKRIFNTSQKCTTFINGKRITIVDKDYTIMEYSPCDKFYNVRIFIDNNGNILEYYFDIILNSQLKNSEIFYEDLYLDVVYDTTYSTETCEFITLVDENELIAALKNGEITKKQFDFAYEIAIGLMDEIRMKKNKFINRGLQDYKNYFDN